ncbi:UDP-2,4-diacetamido-2,4,6-trideoxy-beta-L-altropyranose hydrolase [Metabacillus crassostreae]|uniref:UDP-2,4-diacetamido-2,4, 6-trideoxy-beta-L-altropyranose hydrolase n=1 Tax=Metabacillus crassostreae TaxID=929098 RepID=UPI0019560FF4|nr:UDP-2,4-diacetamido-2,4,6-trideoxy-beta-L-altropyranose hydrolase [Metabacillus crassostreae]MBM7606296.1 UDP-2,4-diacetamido-2,4,6-trideoxy-beta-L-altropyranose hydrolase [Metabacillus crassostreae]
MRALIFTEGGSQIGLGHISRCSSLYDELVDTGIEVEFIINSNTLQLELLQNKQYKIVNWLSKEFLTEYIKPDDYCIVDSYLASEDLCRVISTLSKKTLFIDDNGRIEYPESIVVNPSLSTQAVKYPLNDANCYLLGPKYIILRSNFTGVVKRNEINQPVKEVLITLGGSDLHNLTPSILNQIACNNSEITLNVVIGNAFENIEEIKSLSSNNIEFYENATAEEMKALMLKSDFAITAAGQTIYELLATQTPFIPIKVIENQEHNICALKELNLIEGYLEYNDTFLSEKLILEFENLMKFSTRIKLVERYKAVIDEFGSKRIIGILLSGELMKEEYFLRKAKDEDVYAVFQLSNEDYVRKYSINKSKINWEDHKNWFQSIINSDENVFYVVTDYTEEFLGQLRYKIEDESGIVSISLGRTIAGKGLSKELLKKSLELLHVERNDLKNIIAYVSNDNIASKKLFEKVGFILHENNNGLLKYIYSFR